MKKPFEYIKEAFLIYTKKENFVFFAKIMAVLTIVSTALSLISNYYYPVSIWDNFDYSNTLYLVGFILLSALSLIVNLWVQSTTYFSIFNIGSDEKNIFKTGFSKILKFFVISFVLVLIALGGMILLILPALVFGIWFSFSIFLSLEKNVSVKESLKISKQMVKGKFWQILGRYIIFGLFSLFFSIILSLVPYAGSIIISFVAPLFLLPSYLLYRDLSVNY